MSVTIFEFIPSVVILDDAEKSIGHLKNEMEDMGIKVKFCCLGSEVLDFVRNNIVDLLLLDVNLNTDDPADRGGVLLAETLCVASAPGDGVAAPEAAVIFISRPSALDVEDVLRMFNLKVSQEFRGKDRLAEGFAEKTNTVQVMQMVFHVLSRNVAWTSKTGPRIFAADHTAERLRSQIDKKFGTFTQPMEQFQRLVRELCVSADTPSESLEICDVSKGRSRSIVINTRRCAGDRLIESRILKIGAMQTIRKEIENYKTNVPRILRGGSYPLLVGSASCRQLGGICYSDLGVGAGIPDSFGDRFWDLSATDRRKLLDIVLHELICDSSGPKRKNVQPLYWLYRDRFNSLQSNHPLHKKVPGFLKNSKILKPVSENRIKLRMAPGDEFLELFCPVHAVQNLMYNWHTTGHLSSVVHGDLHPDNILVHHNHAQFGDAEDLSNLLQPFLIDFTHTNPSHASLDYVVMDAMLRSQSLRGLLETLPDKTQALVAQCWVKAEYKLVFASLTEAKAQCVIDSDPELSLKLHEILDLSNWLRNVAHMKLAGEGPGFYNAALGYTCYAFLSLPVKVDGHDYIRDILLNTSSVHFTNAYENGVGVCWINNDLRGNDLANRLAESANLWRTYLLRAAAGDLNRRENLGDEGDSVERDWLNTTQTTSWAPLIDSLRGIAASASKEVKTRFDTHPSVFVASLLRKFLNLIREMGIENPELNLFRHSMPDGHNS